MRPTIDQYMMELAIAASTRTTCIRRGVGCVLADARGHVLSIGYNGVASGLPHCNDPLPEFKRITNLDTRQRPLRGDLFPNACAGHDLPPGQDSCEAVHAEQNALLQCKDPWAIETAYVTLSPCKACLKLLLNTSCKRIVFLEEHVDAMPKELWLKAGREWVCGAEQAPEKVPHKTAPPFKPITAAYLPSTRGTRAGSNDHLTWEERNTAKK